MAPRRSSSSKVPKGMKEPSTWHLVEEGFGIILASLVMIVAAPVFVHAFTGDTASAQTSTDVSPVLAAVADIKNQIDTLTKTVTNLSSKVDALAPGGTDATITAPGMGACLSVCRTTEAVCLKTALKAPLTFTPGTLTATNTVPVVSTADTTCRKTAETCALACKPQTTSVSCQARCAVDLGACIRAAGDDASLAAKCRVRDQVCLADLCVPTSTGSLLLRTSRIPASTCMAQCQKESQICNQSATEDVSAQADCDTVTKVCQNVVCAGTPPPIGATLLQLCENSCTATFNSCTNPKAREGGTVAPDISLCNSRYGICRDNCRKFAGGTNEPFSTTGTTSGATSTTPVRTGTQEIFR